MSNEAVALKGYPDAEITSPPAMRAPLTFGKRHRSRRSHHESMKPKEGLSLH